MSVHSRLGKRGVGRPLARWCDDLRKRAGSDWVQKATDQAMWCYLGEAYDQEWTVPG